MFETSIYFMFILLILFLITIYVYIALALQTIGKKLGYKKSWLAWIPIGNLLMIFEMGGFHWGFTFLTVLPFYFNISDLFPIFAIDLLLQSRVFLIIGIINGIILTIVLTIAFWSIFEKRNYSGYISLLILLLIIPFLNFIASILFLIAIGIVAWNDSPS